MQDLIKKIKNPQDNESKIIKGLRADYYAKKIKMMRDIDKDIEIESKKIRQEIFIWVVLVVSFSAMLYSILNFLTN